MSNFAVKRGKYYLDCNSNVNNSIITSSNIDMNGSVISSHGLPTLGTDVVNKDYVDGLIIGSGVPIITLTLIGTNYTLVINSLTGVFKLSIKNLIANGPSAIFDLTKSFSTDNPSITRSLSSAGSGTFERLLLKWDPSQGIYLRKTGVNYDGNYLVKLDYI